ncbi:glycosyltransferase family 2 protein [Desertivirga xinjiangensis]|uniref:glycosyltransferase family 2 protein n=1 Tax=Desertivirga xinjiangensis TaxID=539206 RepID=UPI002108FAD1|nr:glycosyltransferase family 2 protein [Pedobacter xinjiangensis]
MKLGILLTTFNRKQKTLSCLNSIYRQKLPANVSFDIHLTDDGSADRTAEAVKFHYPAVHVYHGTGSLFWAGGMRNSWRKALAGDYDYYLLLNDDTVLKDGALTTLLQYNENSASPAICVGATCDENGKITYGGKKLRSRLFLKSQTIHSDSDFLDCDLGNANIMLVPAEVVRKIGILSDSFTHGIADYDYTLKAKKAGFKVVTAPGFLGTCIHDHGKNWKTSDVSLKDRIKYLMSPKGLAYHEYLGFIKYHFPLYYPAAFCKLWLKTFFPVIWTTFKK